MLLFFDNSFACSDSSYWPFLTRTKKKTQQNNTSNIKHNESGLVPYIQSLLLFYEKKKYQIWDNCQSPFLVFHNKIAFEFETTWNDNHFCTSHQEVDYNFINGWHQVRATISIDEIGLNSWLYIKERAFLIRRFIPISSMHGIK